MGKENEKREGIGSAVTLKLKPHSASKIGNHFEKKRGKKKEETQSIAVNLKFKTSSCLKNGKF